MYIPPWSKSFRTRYRVALSFGRFQFFFFCCVGRSVIDVLSDFQLDSLTFFEVTLYCVHHQKRPDLWAKNSWILHHDKTPTHNAIVIREHLAKNETNTIQQPPKSPDLAPCDFLLVCWVSEHKSLYMWLVSLCGHPPLLFEAKIVDFSISL